MPSPIYSFHRFLGGVLSLQGEMFTNCLQLAPLTNRVVTKIIDFGLWTHKTLPLYLLVQKKPIWSKKLSSLIK